MIKDIFGSELSMHLLTAILSKLCENCRLNNGKIIFKFEFVVKFSKSLPKNSNSKIIFPLFN